MIYGKMMSSARAGDDLLVVPGTLDVRRTLTGEEASLVALRELAKGEAVSLVPLDASKVTAVVGLKVPGATEFGTSDG